MILLNKKWLSLAVCLPLYTTYIKNFPAPNGARENSFRKTPQQTAASPHRHPRGPMTTRARSASLGARRRHRGGTHDLRSMMSTPMVAIVNAILDEIVVLSGQTCRPERVEGHECLAGPA